MNHPSKTSLLRSLLCAATLVWGSAVQSAPLSLSESVASGDCGAPDIGNRYVTVQGTLIGGLCAAKRGRMDDEMVSFLGLTELERDNTRNQNSATSNNRGLLFWNVGNYADSGSFSFETDLWDVASRLFIGFHFNDVPFEGDESEGFDGPGYRPDAFIVELDRQYLNDQPFTFALKDSEDGRVTQIALFSIPTPGTMALIGLGLFGAAAARRKARRS